MNKLNIFVLSLSVFIAACDGLGEPPVATGPYFKYEIPSSSIFGHQCDCDKVVILKNPIDKKFRVTYRERQFKNSQPYRDDIEKTVTLEPLEEHYVGCNRTSAFGSSNLACDLFHKYERVSFESAFYRIEDVFLASTAKSNLNISEIPINCKQECLDPHNPHNEGYCQNIPSNTVNTTAKQSFRNFMGELLEHKDRELKKSTIMNIFGVQDDPCERSNLHLTDGIMKNTGESACTINIGSSFPEASEFSLNLTIPKNLAGQYSYSGGNIVDFTNLSTSPTINFKDSVINEAYGGRVKKIEEFENKRKVVISTSSGCIGVSY